ncbi:hypothetical protein FW764_20950 [Pseudomonas sp. 1152_12]
MWRTDVGAGLPAMQAPRCIRGTRVMLSQASQLATASLLAQRFILVRKPPASAQVSTPGRCAGSSA